MFFNDIDSWTKKKLYLVTAIWAFAYLVCACIIPVIIVCAKYNIFGQSSFKLTAIGLITIIIVITVGWRALLWLVKMLPQQTKKQQIFRYSIELVIAMILPLLGLWLIHLIKVNADLACSTIQACCYCWIGALLINYTGLKSLRVQFKANEEVDKLEKQERIKNARRSNKVKF